MNADDQWKFCLGLSKAKYLKQHYSQGQRGMIDGSVVCNNSDAMRTSFCKRSIKIISMQRMQE